MNISLVAYLLPYQGKILLENFLLLFSVGQGLDIFHPELVIVGGHGLSVVDPVPVSIGRKDGQQLAVTVKNVYFLYFDKKNADRRNEFSNSLIVSLS